MQRAEMRELSADGQVQTFDSPRQVQHGRRDDQKIFGQGEDGADGADIGCVLVIMAGRLPRGFGVRILCDKRRGNRKIAVGQPALNGWCGLCGRRVKMPARQRKLDRERKQRQPRAVLEVLSKPVHDELRPCPS